MVGSSTNSLPGFRPTAFFIRCQFLYSVILQPVVFFFGEAVLRSNRGSRTIAGYFGSSSIALSPILRQDVVAGR